jgi:hypothetical protein
MAENPPDGAIIDYYLPTSSTTPVTLEVLDSQGKLVRKFSSTDKPELSQEERKKGLIPLYWLQTPTTLSAEAGSHRWVWDLRYPSPFSTEHEYPISATPYRTPRYPLGPTALSGEYTLRLTVDGKTYSAALVVKIDPRVKTPTAGLQKKFELETQLVSAITRSSQAVTQARSAQGQLQELADARGELSERAQSLKAKVSGLLEGPKDGPGAKDQPTLKDNNSNVIALYKEVEKADAEPTAAAINAADKIHSELEPLLKRWEELKNGDLQKLNVKLSAADLPRIDFDRPPEHEEAGENEE